MKRLLQFLLLLFPLTSYSQDDLMNLLDEQAEEETVYTTATFKGTRVINGHSIERMPAGQLDVRFSHRFGELNSGAYNLWGLDQANIHFGLDYGVTNWLMIGVGRGTYEKTYDGLLKFTLLRQSTGKKNMPISLSYLATMGINTLKDSMLQDHFSSRLSYVHQIIVARKFNKFLSLQLSPTYIHKNMVPTELDPNDIWSVGFSGRIKITKRVAITGEYYYVLNNISSIFNYYPSIETHNPLSFGIDIETGGHVFQFVFSNAVSMIEKGFISETEGTWANGDIHFGFNISRVFQIVSNAKAEKRPKK